MYRHADATKLLKGAHRATAHDWIEVTAQIAAAIAREKTSEVVASLHEAFGDFNLLSEEKICPCMECNLRVWSDMC